MTNRANVDFYKSNFKLLGIIPSSDNITMVGDYDNVDAAHEYMARLSDAMKAPIEEITDGVYVIVSPSSDVKSEWFLFNRANFRLPHNYPESKDTYILPESEVALHDLFYRLGCNENEFHLPTSANSLGGRREYLWRHMRRKYFDDAWTSIDSRSKRGGFIAGEFNKLFLAYEKGIMTKPAKGKPSLMYRLKRIFNWSLL